MVKIAVAVVVIAVATGPALAGVKEELSLVRQNNALTRDGSLHQKGGRSGSRGLSPSISRRYPAGPGGRRSAEPSSDVAALSDVKIVWVAVVKTYRWLVSSQSRPGVCVFTPSCSRYGEEAVRRHGTVRGLLMASDRLQRCHGLGGEYYRAEPRTGLCLDPVR